MATPSKPTDAAPQPLDLEAESPETPARRLASVRPRSAARVVARGSQENPANRFDRLAYSDAPEFVHDAPADPTDSERPLATRYFRDPSRTLLARNQSPDIGFDVSLNPYRGCSHGCSYCLAPDTPVLGADFVWRPIGELRVGDELLGFDEYPPAPGIPRRLRRSRVEAVWASRKPTQRLITRHADVTTTAEHRWLQHGAFRWSRTEQLAPGRLLRHMPHTNHEPIDDDYRIGYIAGMTLGDGTFRYEPGWRSDKLGFPAAYWRVALVDREPLERLRSYLMGFGVPVEIRPFFRGTETRKPLEKVETRSLGRLATIHKLVGAELETRSYRRGFLAGFFDAEGHQSGSLRITQVDLGVLDRVAFYARSLGFQMKLETQSDRASTLRLVGSVVERIRWFSTLEPAIARKRESVFGTMAQLAAEPIEAIESGPPQDVVDIQTSTGTFYAAGLATHNCYARPSHEYLGLSAGLDFETHILVKEDAPELLARTLSSPRWEPQVVAIGAVTDPYQPVERQTQLTRRCLQVFARFRNPCAIITKSGLVTRDLDVLTQLAAHRAVSVSVSITSLDDGIRRAMEPRASSPKERLRAVRALADAGIPTTVMVAPIVPGLTDHEIPKLVEAAAEAGASRVRPIVLRLPNGVADLFEAWLERHFPERAAKVMNRVRSLRGGRRNDPRFFSRMRGEGVYAKQIESMFALASQRAGLDAAPLPLSTEAFLRPGGQQLTLL
ncbi:MAG: PA0069 family radical SAM protein [Myxococcota bacterium]